MSDSLNRSFIKAYSKEKPRSSAASSAETQMPNEPDAQLAEFFVQFDTASVNVPRPHMLRERPERAAITEPIRPSSEYAVESIITAGLEAPEEPPKSEPPEADLETTNADRGNTDRRNADRLRAAIAAQMRGAAVNEPSAQAETLHSHPELETEAIQSSPAPQFSAQPNTIQNASEPNTIQNASELDPPAEPALTEASGVGPQEHVAPEAPMPGGHAAESTVISQESADGNSIFRLDRPSYSQASAESAHENELESSIIGSSSILENENAENRNASLKATKQTEENLRQARVRVFNPVWEVDNLQWPEVCRQLIHQRSHNLDVVGKNLAGACQEGLQIMAVTSPQSGEGRTTVACCLAMLAGSHGLNVAVVDGDLENPSLSYQTNLEVDQDWKMAITNQLSLEEVAIHSIDDQVTLVPLLQPVPNDELATSDNRVASMLRDLSESFDLVIVDMGPMSSDRSLVQSLGEQGILNAVVTVVDHRSSTAERIEACLRRIQQTGVNSIGLVENFAA